MCKMRPVFNVQTDLEDEIKSCPSSAKEESDLLTNANNCTVKAHNGTQIEFCSLLTILLILVVYFFWTHVLCRDAFNTYFLIIYLFFSLKGDFTDFRFLCFSFWEVHLYEWHKTLCFYLKISSRWHHLNSWWRKTCPDDFIWRGLSARSRAIFKYNVQWKIGEVDL